MRVAVVTLGDPDAVSTWSGTPTFATGQIRRSFPDTHVVYTRSFDRFFSKLARFGVRIGWDCMREPIVAKLYAMLVDAELSRIQPDVVISIGATHKLGYSRWSGPLIHVSDALYETIRSSYAYLAGMRKRTIRLGNQLQQRLIDKADMLLLSSDWARDGALGEYRLDPDRVQVLPLGANVDDQGDAIVDAVPDRLRLLFVGKYWERKGGDRLMDVFAHVRLMQPDAEVHIVGCEPFESRPAEGVFVHGFFDKSQPEGREAMRAMFRDSAMLCVLSWREAFGLVYCEAAANALPAMANHTGGVPTIIQDHVTGRLFQPDDPAERIAAEMVALWRDQPRYRQMRKAARERYKQVLNWPAWGEVVSRELQALHASAQRQRASLPEAPARRPWLSRHVL